MAPFHEVQVFSKRYDFNYICTISHSIDRYIADLVFVFTLLLLQNSNNCSCLCNVIPRSPYFRPLRLTLTFLSIPPMKGKLTQMYKQISISCVAIRYAYIIGGGIT